MGKDEKPTAVFDENVAESTDKNILDEIEIDFSSSVEDSISAEKESGGDLAKSSSPDVRFENKSEIKEKKRVKNPKISIFPKKRKVTRFDKVQGDDGVKGSSGDAADFGKTKGISGAEKPMNKAEKSANESFADDGKGESGTNSVAVCESESKASVFAAAKGGEKSVNAKVKRHGKSCKSKDAAGKTGSYFSARRHRGAKGGVRSAGRAIDKHAARNSAFFIAPSFIGILIFYALPFLVILFYAFVDNPINKEFVFIDNFIGLFQNAAFKRAAANTLKISLTAVPLAVVLSLILAVALESNIPMKSRFRTFFLSPMMVPAASVVLIWQVLFHHNGAINDIAELLGFTGQDWLNSEYAPIVVVVLFLWKNLGYNMIIFMSALSNIPKEPVEAAAVDGAGRLRQFISIKLRYLSPSILFVAIISLINSFKVFREIYLLTGNYAYESLYTLQHYMNNMLRRLDYQKLSAASVVMFIVMVAIVGVLFIIENKFGKDVE